MLGLFIFVELIDSASFLLAFKKYGINGESSVIPQYMYDIGGVPLVLLTKLLAVLLIALVLLWLAKRSPNASRLGFFGCIMVGILGVVSNSLAVVV